MGESDVFIYTLTGHHCICPFVVGRKNSLFCDIVLGANASVDLYSLIETAKAKKIEPYSYLRLMFTELHDGNAGEDIETLLPYTANPSDNVKSAIG